MLRPVHGVGLALILVMVLSGGWVWSDDISIFPLRSGTNHTDLEGPIYAGKHAPDNSAHDGELIVVTYNLKFGESVAAAIDALETAVPLSDADILLMQEMDEAGTAAIAQQLDLDYVYFPASVAPDGDNFGNAILSRWPLSDPRKIILPGLHPISGQQRTATRATVQLDSREILVYSVHIEISTAPPAVRAGQIEAVIDDIPPEVSHVIVGGDFNAVTPRGIEAMLAKFIASGRDHFSGDLGPTFSRLGVPIAAPDHIFARGFDLISAGVADDVTASDHFPVWVRLSFIE